MVISQKSTAAKTRVLIIGAGKGGMALLKLFGSDPAVEIVGIADVNPRAPGLREAKKANIPVAADFRQFLSSPNIDLIMNVTGKPDLQEEIRRLKPKSSELIGGSSARFLWALVEERQRREALQEKYALMRRELKWQSKGDFIIGSSPRMREVASLIMKVAPTGTTVLIVGETGTGKEVVARAIHRHSHLKDEPLVTVNCTAFSPGLIESELFGYKKGAFTGASTDRIGIIEEAHRGTIFLDEIGDMPMEMQSKLLRFLQSGEIRPVGNSTARKVQVRVIAASNRRLDEAIERGGFRADLFYRLNAFVIELPPLRQRREDIPLMAYHFLKIAQARVNKRVSKISSEALRALTEYDWPGNLRELENVIERAVILTNREEVDVEHLPLGLQPTDKSVRWDPEMLAEGLTALKATLINRLEREAISRYLRENEGNISRSARAAKVSRRTFQRLMAKHQIYPAEHLTDVSEGKSDA